MARIELALESLPLRVMSWQTVLSWKMTRSRSSVVTAGSPNGYRYGRSLTVAPPPPRLMGPSALVGSLELYSMIPPAGAHALRFAWQVASEVVVEPAATLITLPSTVVRNPPPPIQ